MPARLTEKAIAKALRDAESGIRVELSDEALPGLRFRAAKRGGIWVLACRDSYGRMRRFRVGAWPKDGIAAARDAAREMRVKVRGGEDPIAEARRKRAIGKDAQAGIGTLEALLNLYGTQVGSKKKSWLKTRRRIDLVFKAQLTLPLATLKREDLQMAADAYPSPQQSVSAVSGLRPVLKWSMGRSYSAAPLANLHSPAGRTQRERVLSREELQRLLSALATTKGPYAAALRLILLTLARREEVTGARWRDFDLKSGLWRITADRTKNKVEHSIPLSRQALELLRMRPRGGPADLVFASRLGGLLVNWDRSTRVIMEASGTSGWTRHDLRRTGATMLGDMGETPEIIEAALNHVVIKSQIAATYNRSRYRPQVAIALQRLADALDGIAAGGAEVVPMRAAHS